MVDVDSSREFLYQQFEAAERYALRANPAFNAFVDSSLMLQGLVKAALHNKLSHV